MVKVNIHEAKANLSRYIDRAVEGEQVVICKRNVPVAELTRIKPKPKGRRPMGLAKGQIHMTDAFFDPLPDDMLKAWNCETD